MLFFTVCLSVPQKNNTFARIFQALRELYSRVMVKLSIIINNLI